MHAELRSHLQDAASLASEALDDLLAGELSYFSDDAANDVTLAALELMRALSCLRQEQVDILAQEYGEPERDPGPSQDQRL